MSMSERTSQLEAEVEQQRQKLSADIDRLAERLTPGRLLDEMLARSKNGGAAFLSNLGHSATANPVPVTLLGVSLAWLMARPVDSSRQSVYSRAARSSGDGADLPLAPVSGRTMRRVSHQADASGQMWSHFSDESGRTFKAKSDSLGRRAGHFMDDAGRSYRGLVDSAGEQVRSFQDEAGVALDSVTGWAAQTWASATDAASAAGRTMRSGAESVGQHAAEAGDAIGDVGKRLNDSILSALHNQPLAAAAMAFAAGAALAAALPHTETEDDLLGGSSDSVKDMAGRRAGDAYDAAKEKVTEVYTDVTDALTAAGAEPDARAPFGSSA